MALTACRVCKKEVSTEAQACPHCGVASPGASVKPVVIEAAGKQFKAFQAAGGAGIVLSLLVLMAGGGTALTTIIYLAGLGAYI